MGVGHVLGGGSVGERAKWANSGIKITGQRKKEDSGIGAGIDMSMVGMTGLRPPYW